MSRAPILSLAVKSLMNRRLTVGLTLFALAVSMMLVLGVEKVRGEAKLSFANTISGTDLIVGARSGSIQLLLYSVFRIGNATNNISWQSYKEIAARPEVAAPLAHRERAAPTALDAFTAKRITKRREDDEEERGLADFRQRRLRAVEPGLEPRPRDLAAE